MLLGNIGSKENEFVVVAYRWRSGRLRLDQMLSGAMDLDRINEAVVLQQSGEAVRIVLTPYALGRPTARALSGRISATRGVRESNRG